MQEDSHASDNDELCTVQSFPTLAEAELACGMLAEAGIKACIFEESVNVWMGGHLPFGALQLKVFEKDLERAQEVLAQEPWDERIDWSEAERFAPLGDSDSDRLPAPGPVTTAITAVPDDQQPMRFANSNDAQQRVPTAPPTTTFSSTPMEQEPLISGGSRSDQPVAPSDGVLESNPLQLRRGIQFKTRRKFLGPTA